MALIIIDFDHTIVNGHTHNTIATQIQNEKNGKATDKKRKTAEDHDAQWELIKKLPPIGSAAQWKHLLERLAQEGHQIAIASFSAYGEKMIPRYLKEIIGLSDELVGKIFVNSWLPPREEQSAGKNTHISRIIGHFNYEGHPESVILVDDTAANLDAAKQEGYSVIAATEQGAHLEHIEKMFLVGKEPDAKVAVLWDEVADGQVDKALSPEVMKEFNQLIMAAHAQESTEDESFTYDQKSVKTLFSSTPQLDVASAQAEKTAQPNPTQPKQ